MQISISTYLKQPNEKSKKKEDKVFWIEGLENPADKLGKFDINKDAVSQFIQIAKEVLASSWLQELPSNYLDKMLSKYQEQIKLLMQGGKSMTNSTHENLYKNNNPEPVEVNHINCYVGYALTYSLKERSYDSSCLQIVVDRNKHKGSAFCMKVISLATYVAQIWRDKAFLSTRKKCNHPHQCPCEIKLLQDRPIDRPFDTTPLRRPMIIDKKS